MDMKKYLDLFVTEAQEHIQAAMHDLDCLRSGAPPARIIESLFRHFHSLKGMAASMGFSEIKTLSHAVEDLLSRSRDSAAPPSAPFAALLTEAIDALGEMVEEASTKDPGTGLTRDPTGLIERLAAARLPPSPEPAPASPPATTGEPPGAEPASPDRRVLSCVLRMDPTAAFPGARTMMVLRRLRAIGSISDIDPATETMLSPGYAGRVAFRLTTALPGAAVRKALDGLIGIRSFTLKPTAPARRDAATTAESAGAQASTSVLPSTLRVPTASLDHLFDAINAMVMRRGMLSEALRADRRRDALDTADKLSEAIDRLREQIMSLRLLPFDVIVPGIERSVRQLQRATGKKVSLKVTGADVAMDRSVLEAIIDPIRHIIRNAIDHGMEDPRARTARGKPSEGTIHLRVDRSADRISITIEDDGTGMNVEAIHKMALERGYVSRADLDRMNPEQILMLTTIPGFSTAHAVGDISGRGVGMDVVRTQIESLQGHMDISSREGEGTRIEMSLPPSVAVVDALLVGSRHAVLAIPSSTIEAIQRINPRAIRTSPSGRYVAAETEGETTLTPLVNLDRVLSARARATARPAGGHRGAKPLQVVTSRVNGSRWALEVEEILGKHELVVNPLGRPLDNIRQYSGAAVLDDGRIALLVDLANMMEPS